MTWALALHGGAGIMTPATVGTADAAIRAALGRALDAGGSVLARGATAVEAVEAAIHVLEDDAHFNAGRGAALTAGGGIEHDAAIMDGRSRAAGAVAGIAGTRRPISLARAVMERSPHVMLAGAGADRFSIEQGLEQVDPAWFVTAERRDQLAALLAAGDGAFDADMKYGTVGAVARDAAGHLAAATSTGGVTGQRAGRIGDSPLIGAGTYADDRAAAISCTGLGEVFIRVGAAHEIAARIRLLGESLQQAADAVMAEVTSLGGTGGVIAAGRAGETVWSFTTPGMYRAAIRAGGVARIAIYGDE